MSTAKVGGNKKGLGITAPECPTVSAGLGRTVARNLPLAVFMFVQGATHSENVFLIHNMNSKMNGMNSRLDACGGWKVVRWCRTQASSHNSQGVVDGGIDEVGRSTAAPNRSAVLCS